MNDELTLHRNALDYVNQKKLVLAIDCYNKLKDISRNPYNLVNYLLEMGEVYEKMNKNLEAITECYIKVIQIDPNNGSTLNQIGVCYFKMNQLKLAIHYFNKVLKIKELPQVYNNIGKCYINLKDYVSAEKNFLLAKKYDKNGASVNESLGSLYYYIKNYEKSISCYEIARNDKNNEIILDHLVYNLSFPYLAKKEFEKGFELYETRLKIKSTTQNDRMMNDRAEIPFINYWNGTDSCRKLLVIAEQGLGDMIQFYRFIIELADSRPEMNITFFCKQELAHLFKTYNKIEVVKEFKIINDNNFIMSPTYDYKAYLMSLPHLLKVKTIIPNSLEYINTDDFRLFKWKNAIEEKIGTRKPKIGIVYNGLLSSFIEKHIPLEEFKILCELNVDLICIHRKKDIQADIDKYEKMHINKDAENKIHFFEIDEDEPFSDTVGILKNLDLLITIDTYIVHLAGILNVKTWLLLGYSEWRWSNDLHKTYWYNSVELIRTTGEEFKDIVKTKVKDKLTQFTNSHSHVV
jgi:tetratricopeptide (TPR) repeat protein